MPDRFSTPLAHPGLILKEEFMEPLGLSAGALAKAMRLSDRQRIERLVRGTQGISVDTALRLGAVFATSADFWLNLQMRYDLSRASAAPDPEIGRIEPLIA